jgi:hypothetical protein
LLCALDRHDLVNAREIFSGMPEAARNEPMTRFLMYKVAIRCDEVQLAAESLDIISQASAKDPTLLYACCLEAQQIGNKRQTIRALIFLVEKYDSAPPTSLNMPSLLRLIISLLTKVVEGSKRREGSTELDKDIEKLCRMYEVGECSCKRTILQRVLTRIVAVKSLRDEKRSKRPTETGEVIWTVRDLDWFSINAYNTAIKNVTTYDTRPVLRILKSCTEFIDHYPKDIGVAVTTAIYLRKMFCGFTSATAFVALARGQDNTEIQLNDYLQLRKHVGSYDSLLQELHGHLDQDLEQDLTHKLSVLMAFDFEAACKLKHWDDLGEVILKSAVCKTMRLYQLMADCLLSLEEPPPTLGE